MSKMPKTKLLRRALLLTICVVATVGIIRIGRVINSVEAQSSQTPPPGYNRLQEIYVFKDRLPPGFSGGDLVTIDSNIPVDPNQMYESLPSLSFQIPPSSQGWWLCSMASLTWQTYNLEPYFPNGFIEFNVKGAAGGEQFRLSILDQAPERTPANLQHSVASGNFFTVTTEWQHVKIPLSSILPAGSNFRLTQTSQFQIAEAYEGPYAKQFWINALKFTSPNTEPIFPAIKVNQLGYIPTGEKYALVSGFGEVLSATAGTPFQVRRVSDQAPVYSGKLSLVIDYDAVVSGERVLKADFSRLTVPGQYYLHVEASGAADSLPFEIGFRVYGPLLRDAMRYFYHERQGIAIVEPYAEGFARGLGHPGDATMQFRSSGAVWDVSHGWYDAGDFGKWPSFAAGPIVDLLDAYARFPLAFPDKHLNIPESGNGKPDLLDEVKWELDWLLKMQDPASGGFYHMVSPNGCPPSGSCRPEEITQQRYIEDVADGVPNVRPTEATANAVAALARAAGLYRLYDAAFARRLLTAAERGWGYLMANPQNIPATGLWGWKGADDDERLWAAAELFRATNLAAYGQYFLDRYRKYESRWLDPYGSASDVFMRAFLAYNGSLWADQEERSWFKSRFATWSANQLARTQSTWRNFQPPWGYYWASNSAGLRTVNVLYQGALVTGNLHRLQEIILATRSQLNYILGINPLRHSFVSGYGADSVQAVFSYLFSGSGRLNPPPGYMPGGPTIYDSSVYSRFPGKCYVDTNTDWPPSEPAIYYNANLVFAVTLADQTALAPIL